MHSLSKPRHMTPQIDHLKKKNKPCSEGFNTHLWHFQEDRWENTDFLHKPRHVTPQIDHLVKAIPVLRVSTHIYCTSKEIDWRKFMHSFDPSNQLSQIKPCSEGFNTLQEDRWDTFFVNLGM